jgi:hypothetical protein
MKLHLNCRQATVLVLQGEDRALSLSERLALRFHMMICKACPRFVRQVALMRGAVGAWRHYVDEDRT